MLRKKGKFALMNPTNYTFFEWLRRYVPLPTLAGFALLAYILFYGENTAFESAAYHRTIDSLEHVLAVEEDSVRLYVNLSRRMSSDRELMEQIVREQYNMKRSTEDVYLIDYED